MIITTTAAATGLSPIALLALFILLIPMVAYAIPEIITALLQLAIFLFKVIINPLTYIILAAAVFLTSVV